MPRLAALISMLVLALPGAAFAQGAGDDQYQDPFGDEAPSQSSGGGDSGLSDSPNVGGGSEGSSGSSGSSAGAGSGAAPSTAAPSTAAPTAGTTAAPTTGEQLPNTGSDPRILFLLGAAFVLTGAGLRLRTIDPDAF